MESNETAADETTLLIPPDDKRVDHSPSSRMLLRSVLPAVLFVSAVSAAGGWWSRGALAPRTLDETAETILGMFVSNDYGNLKEHTKNAYGFFDFVLEPNREATFSVKNGRDGAQVVVLEL